MQDAVGDSLQKYKLLFKATLKSDLHIAKILQLPGDSFPDPLPGLRPWTLDPLTQLLHK